MMEESKQPESQEIIRPPAPEQPVVIESPLQGDPGRLQEKSGTVAAITQTDIDLPVAHRNSPDSTTISDAPPELAAPQDRRAFSLDALRGLFLLSMTFGFSIVGAQLPRWMYHMQFPGGRDLVEVAGLTWRDLAYVAFLFTMSAALPLTISRRMAKGERDVGMLMSVVRRVFLLLVFALLVGHSNTYFTGYTQEARALAIVGFLIMAMIYTRRRPDWSPTVFRTVNVIGWLAAAAFLALSPMIYDKGMDINRIDGIIVGLAFAAAAGSVIWYLTRENISIRIAILAFALAGYLGARGEGWVSEWWWAERLPLFRLSMLTLLIVVIPGTIAGDLLLRWMKSADEERGSLLYWSNARIMGLAVVCAVLTPLVVVGLYNRWVAETTEIVLGLVVGGIVLTWNPRTSAENLVRNLFLWSAMWLMIGLVLEPFEGGIKKVPDTLSYYFTVTGLTSMLLVSLVCVVDLLRHRRPVAALIDIGHNPLLAYVLFSVFLNSIFEMIAPMRGVLRNSAGETILRSILSTLLVIFIVRWTTRRRIFWRT